MRPDQDKVRVNEAIRIAEVRVVNEDGQQLGVMSADAAKDIARRVGLDLVEISPQASPPVCKIMDYGRYKYEQKKKAASAKKTQHQVQVKEIKFRPRISDHDLEFKLKSARKFLMDGDKVKCRVQFRGREIVYQRLGMELLNRLADLVSDISTVEQSPAMEGRIMFSTLAPNRAAIDRLKAAEKRAREKEAAEAVAQGGAPAEAASEAAAEGEMAAEGGAASEAESGLEEQPVAAEAERSAQEA